MNKLISNLTLHNERSEKVLARDVGEWVAKQNPWRTFNTIGYSWEADGKEIYVLKNGFNLYLFPDASGFIRIETNSMPNNCTLLDAHGKERMRLTVPWQLTTANNPESNAAPTCFVSTCDPYINPADGRPGQFGVRAWVEFAGEYYFELDWRTGKFLWGKEVRF